MPSQHGISGYVEQKSVLSRSPVLAEYFNSRHFAPQARMTLWFVVEHSRVFSIALNFLLHQEDFVPPSLINHSTEWQIWIKIKLYFLAKRLRVPGLENAAWQMLQVHADKMTAPDITSCARIIYSKLGERDERIRGFLQRHVERNMRELICSASWRELLREFRASLAADMYELATTLLLEGKASPYPPVLPQTRSSEEKPEEVKDNELSAVVIRDYSPIHVGDLPLSRGEFLQIIELEANWAHGVNGKGERGYFLRDYVLFYRSDASEGRCSPEGPFERTLRARGIDREGSSGSNGCRPSRRDKAQSILGLNTPFHLDMSKLSPAFSQQRSTIGSIRRRMRFLEAVVSPKKSPKQVGLGQVP